MLYSESLLPKKFFIYFGDEAIRCLFIVVFGNLYIDFCEPIFKLCLVYCLLVRTTMSTVLFVVINISSSFSAERTENGEIAAQYSFSTRRCSRAHMRADQQKQRSCRMFFVRV